MEQLRREEETGDADQDGSSQAYGDGLNTGNGCAFGIFLADAAGDMAVVDRLRPRPTAKTRLSSDSVSPTVATASAPSRPTQKTSTTAKRDSSTISRTMGMASSKMARLRLPLVKSWCDPRRASRIDCQIGIGPGACVSSCVSMKPLHFCAKAAENSDAMARQRKTIEKTERENGSARFAD